MYQYVEVPESFSVEDVFRGHQMGISREQLGDLMRGIHVVFSHHSGVLRGTGDLYVNHPFSVAEIVRRLGLSILDQVIALLHDILERLLELIAEQIARGEPADWSLYNKTVREISICYPCEVIWDVMILTKFDKVTYFEQLYWGNIIHPRIMLIKIADRLHNNLTVQGFELEKRQRYLQGTLGPFLDLCYKARETTAIIEPSLLDKYDGVIRQLAEYTQFRLDETERLLQQIA